MGAALNGIELQAARLRTLVVMSRPDEMQQSGWMPAPPSKVVLGAAS